MKTRYLRPSFIAGCASCCIAAATLVLSSCGDEMNYEEYNFYDKEYVDGSFKYVGGIVSTCYSQIDYDYGQHYGGAMRAAATDEAEYAYSGNDISNFYDGGWSPSNPMSYMWSQMYNGITYCNLFLDKFQGLTFPEHELDLDPTYDKQMHRYNNYKWETRFLRAYFYFCLVRQYGAVPLITSDMSVEEANSLSRTSADSIFAFINDECDAIKDSIIADYNSDEQRVEDPENGRASKYAVLALKARAALYHASPLFNSSDNRELWHQAALACKELVEEAEAGGKGLAESYGSLWSNTNYMDADPQTEIIFDRRVGSTSVPESYNFPVGIEGGSGGNCPTQNLVDAYEDGDERLALTIAQNGDENWPSSNRRALETYYGGRNAQPLSGGTPTGYYLKKLLHGSINLSSNSSRAKDNHSYVLFRMGEAYLDYAEAVFRYLGSADATSSEFPVSARELASKTRERAGLAAFATGMSNSDFWEAYKKERMCELAFEDHRFWDVRRWKEADKYFTSIRELKLTLNEDGTFSSAYNTVSRQWDDKMYLFPIPQTEIMKDPNLTQNPRW